MSYFNEDTPLTKFTIELKEDGLWNVVKYNEWDNGETLIIEWTTHETEAEAIQKNSDNKLEFWK